MSIEVWLSIGSTYSYLTVMRSAEVERSTGIRFDWRPFNLRAIISEIGNSPFRDKPLKERYMWRDLERRAELHRIPIRVPAPYPIRQFDTANRVAVLGTREGWCADYLRATYKRWFLDGQEPGSEPNLSDSLRQIGQDPQRVIEAAGSEAIEEAYRAATAAARRRGIFGAPSFVVGDELFWGDDRLEDALGWHRRHGTARAESAFRA